MRSSAKRSERRSNLSNRNMPYESRVPVNEIIDYNLELSISLQRKKQRELCNIGVAHEIIT